MSERKESKEIETRQSTIQDTTTIVIGAEFFKDIFELMCSFESIEVQVKIREDGLLFRQMDEPRVGLTELMIPKALFRELKRGEIMDSLRFEASDMKAILSGVSKGDMMLLSIDETGKLMVKIKGKRESMYKIPLFESADEETRSPRVQLSVRAKLNIDGILKDAKKAESLMTKGKKDVWSSTIGICSTTSGLLLKFGSGDGIKSASTPLTTGWDIMQFEGKPEQCVMTGQWYVIQALEAISKVTNVAIIEMGSDLPVHIIPQLPFKGSMSLWIAPRIEPEEEVKAR